MGGRREKNNDNSPSWSPYVLAGLFLAAALYCATDPFKHSVIAYFPDFETYQVELPSRSQIPREVDGYNLLQKSTILFSGQVQGPESMAFDSRGRGPYTGVADGRVLFWNGEAWTDFAYTSPNRSEMCGPKPSILGYAKNEHICGRPLGVRFHKKTGDLYIADAYFGLMKVGPEGGLATSLTTEAEGVPFKFTNDLDLDEEGNVYFTDTSTKYYRRNFVQVIFSGENSGRVLKYNAATGETTVLVRDVHFPNGVSLSKDGSFFIFCEGAGRLHKYWLKGEKAGTTELFAILPGFPDNVRRNDKGEFWVAVNGQPSLFSRLETRYPKLRKFMLKLPISAKYQFLIRFVMGGGRVAVAVKYSPEGKLLQILEDGQGRVVSSVSEVEEKDGKLWFGTVMSSFIAVYDLH